MSRIVLSLMLGFLSSPLLASQISNVTIGKIRFWSDSDVVYLVLSGPNLNPANCNGVGFWEVRATTEEAKKRIYAMALMAKATSNPVRVEIHDSTCSGVGSNGYPIIWMLELE